MNPYQLKTIHEVVRCLRDILSARPEYMREKEQEQLASRIVAIAGNERADKWRDVYPDTLGAIFELASDLEWSNVENTTIAWRHVKALTEKFVSQIEEYPNNHPL